MQETHNKKDRAKSTFLTLLACGLIFLFFIFCSFKTPIPPYPPSVIVEVDWEGGGGESGKEGNGTPTESSSSPVKTTTPATASSEDVFASKVEEPNVSVNEHQKKVVKKNKIVEPKPVVPETPVASDELKDLINKVKNKMTKSSGESENSDGNGKDDHGTGPGKGNDVGPGSGPHTGPGTGNGYKLAGRKLLARPQLLDDSQEEGIVIVEITVDENGKVIEAVPGMRGSTTTSTYLYTLARQAAKTAKFSPSPEGSKEQKGTYTFVFKLK